jgi:hypothetical protein
VLYAEISGGILVGAPSARGSSSTTTAQTAIGANVQAFGGKRGDHGDGTAVTTTAAGGTVRIVGPDPFIPFAERPPEFRNRPPFWRTPRLHPGHRRS